jgi:hypothetical protein
MTEKVSLPVFFLIWAETQGWTPPDFHLQVCEFLERPSRTKLLMMPRGHAKSTIIGIYNAWRYFLDDQYRILHQGDQDKTARKCSRDTRAVLRRHPLTAHLDLGYGRGDVDFWWTPNAKDERNPSMQAAGILSNITSSRADEIQNDDVEVQKNIGTPEAREKLRHRLSEQVHIAVPEAIKLWIGTPHTHDSLYEDIKAKGADCLILRMFNQEHRFKRDEQKSAAMTLPFCPEYVFVGIGKTAKLLVDGVDYHVRFVGNKWQIQTEQEHNLIDCYSGALWPERFTPSEMAERRKECNTLNEWDSQYQLHAKPIGDVRLNPDYLIPYDCEPVIRRANGETTMWLGNVQIVSGAMRWDPSGGKKSSDISSVSLVFQDQHGNNYWHRAVGLTGPAVETDDSGKPKGGQVWAICDLVEQFMLTRVAVETNGVGTHLPDYLKAAFKARRISCGVSEVHATQAKNKRILGFIEAPLTSGLLWAHMSVLEETDEAGQTKDAKPVVQMRQFNPAVLDQEDDHLDSLAGALADGPCRLGKTLKKHNGDTRETWRTNSGNYEVSLDFD